jgi:outer membrane protein
VRKSYLAIINFLLIGGVILYLFFLRPVESKKGYILNQQVFNEFNGKRELEKKLNTLKEQHKVWLDSVAAQLNQNSDLAKIYEANAANLQLQEQELTEKYTADIWKLINQYLAEYGKEKGYDFIFGASGDGSLMYASDANNITSEVTTYINKRYEEGN